MSKKGGKRAKVLGGMIKQFQSGMDSIRDKYKNEVEKKKKELDTMKKKEED